MRGSQVLKWTEKVPAPALWMIAATFALACIVIGFLAAINWKDAVFSVQVLHLMVAVIGGSVLIWGFWGGFTSVAGACMTSLAVSIAAGHQSIVGNVPFARTPFYLECILFMLAGYMCIQYIEREIEEETTDRRQLGDLEEEYLDLAKEFGKKEELLKALQKKRDRFDLLEKVADRLHAAGGDREKVIQTFLADIVQAVGKGEVEVVLYHERGITRHSRGQAPIEVEGGRDEIDRWLDEHRTSLLVNNLTRDVRFTPDFGKSREIMSAVVVPLPSENRLGGTLRLTSVVPQAFSHDDLRFATEAANLLVPRLFPGK